MKRSRSFGITALGFVAASMLLFGAACGAPASSSPSSESSGGAGAESVDTQSSAQSARQNSEFDLYVNPKFLSCLAAYPGDNNRFPQVHVRVDRGDLNDTLTLTGKYIKPGLQFDMFTVERSQLNATAAVDPAFHGFGLAWYQSDLEADQSGNMNATIKTILLDQIFGFDTDVSLDPRNTLHVGFWFNNPQDAVACGFDASKPTPFNGEHKAGPLAMITVPGGRSNLGPLCTNIDWSVTPARCNP